MAKKSNINISAIAVIRVIVFLLIGFILFTVYTTIKEFVNDSEIFAVKDVVIDSSIQFIDMRPLRQLKGQNIFKINIKKLEQRIANQYPQISQLRVEREFPDRIKVLAKKREPFAQILVHSRYLVVDREGVTINYNPQALAIPIIYSVPLDRTKIILGAQVHSKEFELVMTVLNEFKNRPKLSALKIQAINGSNSSKIDLSLLPNVHIIIDQDQMMAKIDMLEMLMNQNKVDLNKIKYIDLRFREAVIADNAPEENKEDKHKPKE